GSNVVSGDGKAKTRLRSLEGHLRNVGAEFRPPRESRRTDKRVPPPAHRHRNRSEEVRADRISTIQDGDVASPGIIRCHRQQVIGQRCGRLMKIVVKVTAVNPKFGAKLMIRTPDELDVILNLTRRIQHQPGAGRTGWLLGEELQRNRIEQGCWYLVVR